MTKRKTSNLDSRAAVLDYLNEIGNMAAAKAAVEVCQDPKSTAQARATASSAIFKATGLGGFSRTFTPPEAESPDDPMGGMTLPEMQRLLERLEALPDDEDNAEGVFD